MGIENLKERSFLAKERLSSLAVEYRSQSLTANTSEGWPIFITEPI